MSDEELKKELLDIFKKEGIEHVQSLALGLVKLEQNGEDFDLISKLFIDAHSLKGDARAIDLKEIESISQSLENVLSKVKKGEIKLLTEHFDVLQTTVDTIEKLLSVEDTTSISISYLLESLEKIANQIPDTTGGNENKKKDNTFQDKPGDTRDHIIKQNTLKITNNELDSILNQLEDLLSIKDVSNKSYKDAKKIHYEITKLQQKKNQNFENVNSSKVDLGYESLYIQLKKQHLEESRDLEVLNQRMYHYINYIRSSFYELSKQIDHLMIDLKKVLMQPLSLLLAPLPKMIRDIARSLGKEVILNLKGGEVEIDKRVLDALRDPLIHILRNAIDHGIEEPTKRILKLKPEKGIITIHSRLSIGNILKITISDDGRGINYEKIREKIKREGLYENEKVDAMTLDQLNTILLQTDLSTRDEVSYISGRGVGLNVVNDKIQQIDGTISITSELDRGTDITLMVPVERTHYRGVHIKICDKEYIIPTSHIKFLAKIKKTEIINIEGKKTLSINDQLYPICYLANCLGLKTKEKESEDLDYFIILLGVMNTTYALIIDEIINEKEFILKGLGDQINKLKNILGTTLIDSKRIVPVIDTYDLLKNISISEYVCDEKNKKRAAKVLIVDDSHLLRLKIQDTLSNEELDLIFAEDGKIAWALLQKESVDIVITDLKMPNMDGYELIQKIKNDNKLRFLPVIICSALDDKEDFLRLENLGVNAYIEKKNLEKNYELIKTIGKFTKKREL